MLSRFRLLMLGSFLGGALLLAPENANAQFWGPGYGWGGYGYGGYYPAYGQYYYSYSPYYSPFRGRRYWSGYGGGFYQPWYGSRRFGWYGLRYPRYSIQIGPFGYTRW